MENVTFISLHLAIIVISFHQKLKMYYISGSRESAPTNNREQAQTSERFFSFSRRVRSPARARPRRRTLALALAKANSTTTVL